MVKTASGSRRQFGVARADVFARALKIFVPLVTDNAAYETNVFYEISEKGHEHIVPPISRASVEWIEALFLYYGASTLLSVVSRGCLAITSAGTISLHPPLAYDF